MDHHNTFHTRWTYNMVRLEYLLLLIFCSALLLIHIKEVRWVPFLVCFAWIDVVGTLPAYYVYYLRRSGVHRTIHPAFYYLYNFCHSFVTNIGILAVWYVVHGGGEWAMLGIGLHLFGDRSLFGNIYKPLGLAFEPVVTEEFQRFLREHEKAGRW